MKCPVCGASNPEDARFCSLCLTPFGVDGAVISPIANQSSIPPDYPDDTEEPPIKRGGKFSDWFARFGCLTICLGVVATLAIIFLPRVIGADCQRVSDSTFQKEVLDSYIPVLVVFTHEELWNMKRATPVMGGYTDPAPVILAVKEIIKEGEYKNKIKFCKYYTCSGDNTICEEYSIKTNRPPTVIVFRYGSIYWTDEEGGWCYVSDEMIEEDKDKIEAALREALGEM